MTTLTPPQHGHDVETVRIMLVDDHAIVRQGLRSILERERDLIVVAEASTPDEALPGMSALVSAVAGRTIGPGRVIRSIGDEIVATLERVPLRE